MTKREHHTRRRPHKDLVVLVTPGNLPVGADEEGMSYGVYHTQLPLGSRDDLAYEDADKWSHVPLFYNAKFADYIAGRYGDGVARAAGKHLERGACAFEIIQSAEGDWQISKVGILGGYAPNGRFIDHIAPIATQMDVPYQRLGLHWHRARRRRYHSLDIRLMSPDDLDFLLTLELVALPISKAERCPS